jgi:2-isopropylmalate synthase
VGRNAFAHKGGMHVAGVNVDPGDVRARRPGSSGQRARAAHLGAVGKGTCAPAPRPRGLELDEAAAQRVVDRVKELEHRGYHFEAADGSFELLLRKETGEYEPLFRLESWRPSSRSAPDGKVETEATIKIWVDGERYVRTAEGNGPVNALDKALRSAISEILRTSTTSRS